MLAKRIIPCLDIKDGIVVKGKGFENLRQVGDPVKLAEKYCKEGADELVLLDISASAENRQAMPEVVRKVARQIFIPFTVGGGVKNSENINELLRAGADKVAINTAAVQNPGLISEAAGIFGSQCIVIAIDAKKEGDLWKVFVKGGKIPTQIDALEWAKNAERLGAGEILLTSIDNDGKGRGYDIELTKQVSESVKIPVIASGGAGTLKGIADVLIDGKADAALAASIFHYGKYSIADVKKYLQKKGVMVRI
ncbi:imidazole glycerol phosphate synthase subunit HisF [Candidatus Woesearchaeota archaeon]|nr:imidazole glycerol phosphate synthase subunit HisF [Candidatus Woesearchaeota archaeon]